MSEEVRFECTRCGRCCIELRPVIVLRDIELWLSKGRWDLVALLEKRVSYSLGRMLGVMYCYTFAGDGPCPFYEDGKCLIYDIRPLVCRLFPFAYSSRGAAFHPWALENCPGVGRGRPFTESEVKAVRALARLIVRELVALPYYDELVEDVIRAARRRLRGVVVGEGCGSGGSRLVLY